MTTATVLLLALGLTFGAMPQAATGAAGPSVTSGAPNEAARQQDGVTETTTSPQQRASPGGAVATAPGSAKAPPTAFEPNRGQAEVEVDYVSRGPGYTLSLIGGDAVFDLTDLEDDPQAVGGGTVQDDAGGPPTAQPGTATVRMHLADAAPDPSASGTERLPGVSNYLRGNDQSEWHTGVPRYAGVRYDDVYPGVDVVYRSDEDERVAYDFELAPGADPKAISLAFRGAEELRLSEAGDLLVDTPAGTLRQSKPVVYQPTDAGKTPVAGRFVVDGDRVGFELGDYDPTRPVVIDPAVTRSSYLGGNRSDAARDVAVDADGNTYVAGSTRSADFPTSDGAPDDTCGTSDEGCSDPDGGFHGDGPGDAFVSKLDSDGELVYSTYLGGSGDEAGRGIAVTDSGSAHLAGMTSSEDFPGTAEGSFGGMTDAFVAKLSPEGTELAYSTYLGGSEREQASGVALDGGERSYVVGSTGSADFPTSSGSFQQDYDGGGAAFATKLDPGGDIVYSTYLGGVRDKARDVAVDAAGNAYLVGRATTPNASPVEFVTKLGPAGSKVVYSTLTAQAWSRGIAVDVQGHAYVTGYARGRASPFSWGLSLSEDGRTAAFDSTAADLVPGDTNDATDVFVRDRGTGTARVSVASDGTQADGLSRDPSVSADGQVVAFESAASNLADGDDNGHTDVFVRDRQEGTTERVSVASDGTEADSGSFDPAVSADGRYVAFASAARNLAEGGKEATYETDVYVHDRQENTTERVSVASDGTEGDSDSTKPAISGDGQVVAFGSDATNLVDGDDNGHTDVFVRDRQEGTTERVSVASDGTEGDSDSTKPAISGDGQVVAFESTAENLIEEGDDWSDVFVRDRQAGTTERVSEQPESDEGSIVRAFDAAISADGQTVTFAGAASGAIDVFARDRQTDSTTRVSVSDDGAEGNGPSGLPAVSGSGEVVAFWSDATNLVADDTNEVRDVFVRDRQDEATARMSVADDGAQASGPSVNDAVFQNECTDNCAYVTKLDPAGAEQVYSTFLGGSGFDAGHGIALDDSGRVHVSGETESVGFPTTPGAFDDSCERCDVGIGTADGFLSTLEPDGSALVFSTYLGGSEEDTATAVAADSAGDAHVVGVTESSEDFPTVAARQPDYGGGGTDAFVAKVTASPDPLVYQVTPAEGPTAGGTEVTITGAALEGVTEVRFGDRPARSFEIVSDSEITAVSPAVGPPAIRPEVVNVRVSDGEVTSPVASRARFSYVEGLWQTVGEASTARWDHTATRLPDGRVLLAGGTDADETTLGSAEIYDPDGGDFTATGEGMADARAGHTATLLDGPACAGDSPPDHCGKVLVTGGTDADREALDTAELYDPEHDRWQATEPMGVARNRHTATRLDGPACAGDDPPEWCGKVLVAGGPSLTSTREPQRAAALYDPAEGAWEPAGDLGHARAYHTATPLDGPACRGDAPPEWCDDVLMVGGQGTTVDEIPPAEAYDPAGNAWRPPSEEANLRHVAHTATNLAGGSVLVAGGGTFIELTESASVRDAPPRAFAELYEPAASDPWQLTGTLQHARAGHAATWLPNRKVLAAGGRSASRSAELYEPGIEQWYAGGSMALGRMPAYYLGVAGRSLSQASHSATLLSADPDGFRADPAACGEQCGQVLVVGGSDEPTAELYTPGPAVTEVDPATADAGSQVTITGTGFTAGEGFADEVAVLVDGQRVDPSQVTVDSYSQITATTPTALDGSAGEVVVRTPAGLDDFPEPEPEPAEDDGGAGGTGGTGGTEDDGGTDGDADETAPAAVDDPNLAPGRVDDLAAEAQSGTEIGLSFSSVSADGDGELPPAGDYVVKQSPEPIDSEAAFADAFALCGGVCSFGPAGVGDALTLTVTELDPDATYHYAVKARDEAGNLSERSNPASATTSTATVGDGPASACADDLVSASGFADVAADSVHRAAIDCVAWYAITLGMGDLDGDGANEYAPNRPITRAQMASFLVRLGGEAGLALPADAPDAFGDDDGSVHELRINALAALGITEGKGDLDGDGRDEYAPGQPVSRDQMASFIARLHRRVTGTLAEPGEDFFGDDDGSVHEDNINALAATGITEGKGDLDGDGAVEYAPRLPVSRAQMASFMARELDALATAGAVHPGGAEVLLDATEVRAGEALTGRVRSHREVVSLTADGCGLADEPVSLNPDLGFPVPVATDQPAGECQLTLTAATSPIDPDAEGGPQSVAYDFTVTVIE